MERFIGLLLFIVAIYVATTVATEGLDHAFGGLFASEPRLAVEEATRSEAGDGDTAPAARRPITERVRIQVQGDVDDYSRRIGAE